MSLTYDKQLLNSNYYVKAVKTILEDPLSYAREFYDNYDNLQSSSEDGFVKPSAFLDGFLIPEVISSILLSEIYDFDFNNLEKSIEKYIKYDKIFAIEFLLEDINKLDYPFKKYLNDKDIDINNITDDDLSEYAQELRFNSSFQQFEDTLIQETSNIIKKDSTIFENLINALDYKYFFKPKARLLLQLGDQLIKDEGIALFELVKNSYDADATYSKVYLNDIDNKNIASIIINDNGCGMNYDLITNHWLQPGTDLKEKQIKEKKVSNLYKRLPLGEKGIGRFGVHKLGQNIVLYSKTDFDEEVKISIDWKDFEDAEYLSTVPINIKVNNPPEHFKKSIFNIAKDKYESIVNLIVLKEDLDLFNSLYILNGDSYQLIDNIKPTDKIYFELKKKLNFYDYSTSGTYIKVSDIWENWSRGMLRSTFREVNAINSPFENNKASNFKVEINTNKENWLDKLQTTEDAVKNALFLVEGFIEKDLINFTYTFRPLEGMNKVKFRTIQKEISLEEKIEMYDDVKKKHIKEIYTYSIEDYGIGKINFEFYIYDLGNEVKQFIENDFSGLKLFLKQNGGIRIYRDKIRVYDYGEPGNDWLKLDFKRVSNPTQKISNNQLLGAIYLDRNTSKSLIEKTNREGFIINEAYEKFAQSISQVVSEISLERGIDKGLIKYHYGPRNSEEPVISSLNKLSSYVDANIKDPITKENIKRQLLEIEEEYSTMTENLLSNASSGLTMTIALHEIEKAVAELIKRAEHNDLEDDIKQIVLGLHNTIITYSSLTKIRKDEEISLKNTIKKFQDVNFYRIALHNITFIDNTVNLEEDVIVKFPEKQLIASLSNILDNSIYWLEEKANDEKKRGNIFEKKIFVDITYDISKKPTIVLSDNGKGFGSMPTEVARRPHQTNKKYSMGLGLYIIDETMKSNNSRLIFPERGDIGSIPDDISNAIIALEIGGN